MFQITVQIDWYGNLLSYTYGRKNIDGITLILL